MRGALTGNTIFATVALARQASSALILVVEGDDDHFVLKQHINEADVLLICGTGGKKSVLRAAEIAERQRTRGVRFFVDADFDHLTHEDRQYPSNVVSSRGHDAVMDMVNVGSVLLDRVIDTHARAGRRSGSAFETSAARAAAYQLSASLAPLRIVNEREGYGLRLRRFPFGNISRLPANAETIAAIAINRSGTPLTAIALAAEVTAEQGRLALVEADLYIGDHDLFGALSRVLSEHGVFTSGEALWSSFLSGVLCAHLGATDWYQEIEMWGAANQRRPFDCPCAA